MMTMKRNKITLIVSLIFVSHARQSHEYNGGYETQAYSGSLSSSSASSSASSQSSAFSSSLSTSGSHPVDPSSYKSLSGSSALAGSYGSSWGKNFGVNTGGGAGHSAYSSAVLKHPNNDGVNTGGDIGHAILDTPGASLASSNAGSFSGSSLGGNVEGTKTGSRYNTPFPGPNNSIHSSKPANSFLQSGASSLATSSSGKNNYGPETYSPAGANVVPTSGANTVISGQTATSCCKGPYPGKNYSINHSKPAPSGPISTSSGWNGNPAGSNSYSGSSSGSYNPSINGSPNNGFSAVNSISSTGSNVNSGGCCKGPFPGPTGSIHDSKPAYSSGGNGGSPTASDSFSGVNNLNIQKPSVIYSPPKQEYPAGIGGNVITASTNHPVFPGPNGSIYHSTPVSASKENATNNVSNNFNTASVYVTSGSQSGLSYTGQSIPTSQMKPVTPDRIGIPVFVQQKNNNSPSTTYNYSTGGPQPTLNHNHVIPESVQHGSIPSTATFTEISSHASADSHATKPSIKGSYAGIPVVVQTSSKHKSVATETHVPNQIPVIITQIPLVSPGHDSSKHYGSPIQVPLYKCTPGSGHISSSCSQVPSESKSTETLSSSKASSNSGNSANNNNPINLNKANPSSCGTSGCSVSIPAVVSSPKPTGYPPSTPNDDCTGLSCSTNNPVPNSFSESTASTTITTAGPGCSFGCIGSKDSGIDNNVSTSTDEYQGVIPNIPFVPKHFQKQSGYTTSKSNSFSNGFAQGDVIIQKSDGTLINPINNQYPYVGTSESRDNYNNQGGSPNNFPQYGCKSGGCNTPGASYSPQCIGRACSYNPGSSSTSPESVSIQQPDGSKIFDNGLAGSGLSNSNFGIYSSGGDFTNFGPLNASPGYATGSVSSIQKPDDYSGSYHQESPKPYYGATSDGFTGNYGTSRHQTKYQEYNNGFANPGTFSEYATGSILINKPDDSLTSSTSFSHNTPSTHSGSFNSAASGSQVQGGGSRAGTLITGLPKIGTGLPDLKSHGNDMGRASSGSFSSSFSKSSASSYASSSSSSFVSSSSGTSQG